MDLSNKSLALLLLAAMCISLGSTGLTLNKLREGAGPVFVGGGEDLADSTAMVAGSGWTAVEITGFVGCNVDTNVDFGTNQTPSTTLTLSSNTANSGGGVIFNDCSSTGVCSGMQINNTGNVDVNVTFNSSVGATGFLVSQTGLSDDDFVFTHRNGTDTDTEPGCTNSTKSGVTAQGWGGNWNNVNTTVLPICYNLSYVNANDMITIEYNVTLEPDTAPGTKNATIQVDCLQI